MRKKEFNKKCDSKYEIRVLLKEIKEELNLVAGLQQIIIDNLKEHDHRFDRLEAAVLENSKDIKINRKAIERNAKAIERNAKAIERNAKAIEGNAKAIEHNSQTIDRIESKLDTKFDNHERRIRKLEVKAAA